MSELKVESTHDLGESEHLGRAFRGVGLYFLDLGTDLDELVTVEDPHEVIAPNVALLTAKPLGAQPVSLILRRQRAARAGDLGAGLALAVEVDI